MNELTRDSMALEILFKLLDQPDDLENQQLRLDDYEAYVRMYAQSAYDFADAMIEVRNS